MNFQQLWRYQDQFVEGALITLLRYNLEREGYRVLEAQDGEEALLVAAEEKPLSADEASRAEALLKELDNK